MNKPNLIPTKFDAIFKMVGGSISGTSDGTDMKYNSGQTPPSEETIEAKFKELTAEYDAQEYARNRASAFPSIGDQLDMQYHDQIDGTTTWKDAIAKVKSDNPKPK